MDDTMTTTYYSGGDLLVRPPTAGVMRATLVVADLFGGDIEKSFF